MLFASITRKPLPELPNTRNSVVHGDLFWSWAADGVLGTDTRSEGQIQLVEKCTYQNESSDVLSSIELVPMIGAMKIRCPTVGGRPLYFYTDKDSQFYCSTHINMLRRAGVPIAENTSAIGEYLMYRCVMPPRTMYKEISQVMLGGELDVRIVDKKVALSHHYFQISAPNRGESFPDMAEKIKLEIGDCLSRNTTSTGNFLLSGGIDSSIIFQLGKERLGIKESWSSGYPFEDPNLDMEKSYATTAANSFGSAHHHFVPTTKRYQEATISCIAAAELPLHHLQSTLMYLLSKDCFGGSSDDVVVNGVGAGGLFGNFRNFLYYQRHRRFRMFNNALGSFFLKQLKRTSGRGEYLLGLLREAKLATHSINSSDSIWRWHAYGCWPWVQKYTNQSWESVVRGPAKTIHEHQTNSLEDIWALYSFAGDETITVNIWSKLSESAGRATLFPFYDDQVVDTARKISWAQKLAAPENRLRKSVATLCEIPPEIINRRKSGFGVHRTDWSRPNGPFEPLVRIAGRALNEEDLRSLQADETMAMSFWILLNFGLWRRICINGDSVDDLMSELGEERERLSASSSISLGS